MSQKSKISRARRDAKQEEEGKNFFFDGSFVDSEAAMPFVGVLNNKQEINKDEWT